MNVAGLVTKIVIQQAIQSHNSKVYAEQQAELERRIIQFLVSHFSDVITDENELRWLVNDKIIPMVRKMDAKKRAQIMSTIAKNEKLAAKGKPIVRVLSDNAVNACHKEYLEILQAEARAEELRKKNAIRAAAYEKAHKAYVYENGESEAEIAQKMF